MTADDFREVCVLTVRLTELRLKDCPHLCIENYAPELLAKLIGACRSDIYYVPADSHWRIPE